jgi:predicted nucleic acid-binding protein
MILVVDASAIAAVLFHEAEGETIRAHVRDETMIAPQLIDYELANAGIKKARSDPDAAAKILTMLSGLRALAIRRLPVPIDKVATLAARTGLSAYDASYLWLAFSKDAELVTLDRQLARADRQLRGF